MQKRGLFIICLLVPILLLSTVASAGMQLEMDGNVLSTVVIKNGRSFLPIRELAEIIGAEVSWDKVEKTAYMTKGDVTVTFAGGKTEYRLNGKARMMDVAAYNAGGRIHVPVRFAAESLGYRVTYDQKARAVRLHSKKQGLTSSLQWQVLTDNSVEFALTMKNSGDVPVDVEIPSGQDFEMIVKQDGAEIYRWSDGRFFTMALRFVTYAPGQERTFSWEWLPPVEGTYEVEVYYLGTGLEEPVVRETLVVDWDPSV